MDCRYDLPDHLVVEILGRLPCCKLVFQCKSVCKHWHTLISDPFFIRFFIGRKVVGGFLHFDDHTAGKYLAAAAATTTTKEGRMKEENRLSLSSAEQQQQKLAVMICDQHHPFWKRKRLISLFWRKPISDPQRFWVTANSLQAGQAVVVGVCNDLLLSCKNVNVEERKHELSICNVQTRQCLVLPSLVLPNNFPPSMLHYGFMCDPYYSNSRNSGEVILNAAYRYSVVAMAPCIWMTRQRIKATKSFSAYIFSSASGKWIESVLSLPRPSLLRSIDTYSFAYKGMLHVCGDHIIAFDPYKYRTCTSSRSGSGGIGIADSISSNIIRHIHDCHLIGWPSDSGAHGQRVAVQQGRLHTLSIDYDSRLVIWVLKDYKIGEWSLQQTVALKDLVPSDSHLAVNMSRHGFHKELVLGFNHGVVYLLYRNPNPCVVLYNVKRRTLKMTSSIPARYRDVLDKVSDPFVFWLKLPLWPTPLPTSASTSTSADGNTIKYL